MHDSRPLVLLVGVLLLAGCATPRTTAPATVSDPIVRALIVAPRRPTPAPVPVSPGFTRAIERGTRTRTGRPGPRYWQQHAEYALAAELDPSTNRVTGQGTIRYHNRSPDTLRTVAVQMHQNLFAPTARRNEPVPVTGGMELARVVADGVELHEVRRADSLRVAYWIDGTVAWLRLPRALAPGAAVDLAFTWSFTVPPDGAPRQGTNGETYQISYWYPQIAVYDDVVGWQADQYMGNAEFHMGFGDYDVRLTVPHGWVMGATGTLANPVAVLSARVRERLAEARRTGRVVRVVADDDRVPGRSTISSASGKLTWHWRATNVRDFAWAVSSRYVWDATIALGADANADGRPDTADVHALYRPERRAWAWDSGAHYARHSIEFLSRLLWPYGYPQMTASEGVVSCAGMEYPMLTCIGGPRDTLTLYSVIVHEVAHMWIPMQVASDEKRHAWLDEGTTRFNQSLAMNDYFRGYDRFAISRNAYLAIVAAGNEVELMRHGDLYPPNTTAFGVASYDKMSLNLLMLRALLGDETFLRAYRELGRRWIGKHPTPWDFWSTFEDVSGRNLGWFWRTWWFETWPLDQAIAEVRRGAEETEIEIEDRGLAPMPVRLAVTRSDGRVERIEAPVEPWLAGARRQTVRVRSSPDIVRVEIDPERWFPDVDTANQLWTPPG